MKALNEILRVTFDATAQGLDADISAELANIDSMAAEIRKAGKSPHDDAELLERISILQEAVTRGTWQTVAQLRAELDETRAQYEAEADKNANRELMRLEMASRRIAALSDDAVKKLAFDYTNETAELSLYELYEVSARLRHEDSAEKNMLAEAMRQRRADKPWINTPETKKLADEADLLASLPAGSVAVSSDEGMAIVDVTELIDFEGALDVEVSV